MHNDLIRRLRWEQKPGAESETTVLMSEAADALEAMQEALLYAKSGFGIAYDAASKHLNDEVLLHCGHHEARIDAAMNQPAGKE